MKKNALVCTLITALVIGLGGTLLFSMVYTNYLVHCWEEVESTGRVYCRMSFFSCPSPYKQGYPPPPLQCPIK
jgi:hypothetical protein